jgi:hypothetical protein
VFTGKSNTKLPQAQQYALGLRALFLMIPALFFLFLAASSQNISGIVNSYYRVVEVIPAKSCIRLNVTSGLTLNDKVMLIQMKGATINTDPVSASFGDTTSLNNAGNYEMNTVCYVVGDSVFLVFKILNTYTVADKVQMVRVPQYTNAVVTDTLKAAPWNNTTGTGGVLAIYVNQDLTLNAPIYADSSGYRGGAFRISGSNCNNSPGANLYAYNGASSPTQNGAYKGEGIADVAASINGGMGAAANGGGGGNNHNNGGAGGANLTIGGDGGGNSSAGTFNCKLALQGKAGKALSSHGGKKIFAGGGGGAGHVNNGYIISHGGGNGGGIIFIHAGNLVANGHKISANGLIGGAAASDGAAGGGAGGTLIMDIANYTGAAIIQANGGQGGTEADGGNINYCYGAGGGGSGGAIYFSGTAPMAPVTVVATAGAAGPETGRDVSCNPIVPSVAGGAGQIFSGYSYRRSELLAGGYCSVLLPLEYTFFNARPLNGQALLTWKVNSTDDVRHFDVERSTDGSFWEAFSKIEIESDRLHYEEADALRNGNNYYRIKIVKRSGAVVYSPARNIYKSSTGNFNIYPNPANQQLSITGISHSFLMEILDMTGRAIFVKQLNPVQSSTEINLPGIPAGVYLVKIGTETRRLVIR